MHLIIINLFNVIENTTVQIKSIQKFFYGYYRSNFKWPENMENFFATATLIRVEFIGKT